MNAHTIGDLTYKYKENGTTSELTAKGNAKLASIESEYGSNKVTLSFDLYDEPNEPVYTVRKVSEQEFNISKTTRVTVPGPLSEAKIARARGLAGAESDAEFILDKVGPDYILTWQEANFDE